MRSEAGGGEEGAGGGSAKDVDNCARWKAGEFRCFSEGGLGRLTFLPRVQYSARAGEGQRGIGLPHRFGKDPALARGEW